MDHARPPYCQTQILSVGGGRITGRVKCSSAPRGGQLPRRAVNLNWADAGVCAPGEDKTSTEVAMYRTVAAVPSQVATAPSPHVCANPSTAGSKSSCTPSWRLNGGGYAGIKTLLRTHAAVLYRSSPRLLTVKRYCSRSFLPGLAKPEVVGFPLVIVLLSPVKAWRRKHIPVGSWLTVQL
jgi:hypothetical protein